MTNHPNPEVKQPVTTFHVLLVAALFVFIRTFSVLSPGWLNSCPLIGRGSRSR